MDGGRDGGMDGWMFVAFTYVAMDIVERRLQLQASKAGVPTPMIKPSKSSKNLYE